MKKIVYFILDLLIDILPSRVLSSILKWKRKPIVLMYHRISDDHENDEFTNYTVKVDRFRAQMMQLISLGFNFDFEENYYGNNNKTTIIVTFDDGYRDNYENVFPFAKDNNIKFTENVIAEKIFSTSGKYMSIEMINELIQSGIVSVQAHSSSHKMLTECTEEELTYEVRDSRKKLMMEFPEIEISTFVYPCQMLNKTVAKEVAKYYKMAYGDSMEKDIPSIYRIPRMEVTNDMSDIVKSICKYQIRKGIRSILFRIRNS